MKKIAALLLILTGVSIFFYPAMKDRYVAHSQEQIIKNWEKNEHDQNTAAASLNELEEVFSISTEAEADSEEQVSYEPGDAEKEASKEMSGKVDQSMLGVIEIDKIGLQLPILYGASMSNLDIASGLLEGTALPGMPGNSAIAAHRSRTYGKMFNRLEEIKLGDKVKVRDKNKTYEYEVYETLVVEPHDLSVLNGTQDEKVLTLITCTPIDTATHRLIIKAKMP